MLKKIYEKLSIFSVYKDYSIFDDLDLQGWILVLVAMRYYLHPENNLHNMTLRVVKKYWGQINIKNFLIISKPNEDLIVENLLYYIQGHLDGASEVNLEEVSEKIYKLCFLESPQ